jgi:hypothetical protein
MKFKNYYYLGIIPLIIIISGLILPWFLLNFNEINGYANYDEGEFRVCTSTGLYYAENYINQGSFVLPITGVSIANIRKDNNSKQIYPYIFTYKLHTWFGIPFALKEYDCSDIV